MKVALIHLSDIHISSSKDVVLGRAPSIAVAVKGVEPAPDAYIIVVSGDVAYSGRADQYRLADTMLGTIATEIEGNGKPVFRCLLPGNHDLDFTSQPDTRPRLLESIRGEVDRVQLDGETVRQMLTVQENFFNFEASMMESAVRGPWERLTYSHSFRVDGQEIRVNCFNTAWVSANPEPPGQLVFPPAAMKADQAPAELVISMFHHPYNWLAPENARVFRRFIDATSDVVLTGHEHESEVYAKVDQDSATTHYVEGGVLQESSGERSTFNLVAVDTVEKTYEVTACRWLDGRYESRSLGTRNFVRNRHICGSVLHSRPEFLRLLSDSGLPVLHPSKRDVRLEEVYIYPALSRKNPESKFQVMKIIESSDVLGCVRDTPHLLISGEDLSGKTSLAKRLYCDLHSSGDVVPVLLTGNQFSGIKQRDVQKLLEHAFLSQYEVDSARAFFELEFNHRAVLVDDWHEIKYNPQGRAAVVQHLKSLCGRVILVTNRLYAIEELAELGPLHETLAAFEFVDIREFGKRLTGQLIEKWYRIGQGYDSDPNEYAYAVASSEQKIAGIIRKGFLPTYPIFLLGLLQADQSARPASDTAGSYGYIVESVITARLAEVSAKSTDVGLMYTYASRIAYRLFERDAALLSSAEVSEVHEEYRQAYQMKVSQEPIIRGLVQARILCREGDSYRFTYKGCYCYFVAKYFAENLVPHENRLRSKLDDMVDRLGFEDYTNIVMFFLYLTRDHALIERILANAAKIYGEWEPSDLETDVTFLNKLMREKPRPLQLPSTDVGKNRDEYRGKQDEQEAQLEQRAAPAPDLRVPYDPGLAEIAKILIAFQNLRVMGQVLRSFPGVLPREPKYRLAEASYLLGLRTLRRLLALAEGQLDGLRVLFAETFRQAHPLATQEEVENSADQKLIWLTGAVCYGMIKKICVSIGLEDLELTFEEVRKTLGEKTSIRLIDLAIHLEYFRKARVAEVLELERASQKNLFVYKILQDLVVEFLYLHNTDLQVLRRLGQLFGIRANDARFLVNKSVGS